jgi:hypothetical protein
VTALRPMAGPFVVAAPAGARVRARLRVSGQDEAVLRTAGSHLGSLAGRDLAARCAEGRLDAAGRAASRAWRKRALTAESSSRWAGAITRTSEDQWQFAGQNLRAQQSGLRARTRIIEARLAVPAGGRVGRVRGYATLAERHGKAVRLQVLKARLAAVDRRLAAGTVSVVRGGRALLRRRGHLATAGLTEARWRGQWEAARLFLTADGEKDKAWGNETIRWNPDEGWLEIRLPAPLGHLANRPHRRYRLSCLVEFSYRGDEVAAQAAGGAVRYDISYDPARGRWYLDASWRTLPGPAPVLADLRQAPVLAVDLNHGHLDAWVITPDGNPAGPPVTIPLVLAGLPASRRDGRVRAAISELIGLARQHGCRAVVIEDLDFTDAREQGRERHGSRPSRGRPGRGFRRLVAGIPAGKFRDRLAQMAANAGLAVIAVGPAYTSRWGREHWLALLQEQASVATVHHAAAVVIGRRALGHRARRRAGVTGGGQRTGRRRAAPRAPVARRADRNGRPCQAQRQPPSWPKTATARRTRPPDQAAQDRSGPPASQDHVLRAQQERSTIPTRLRHRDRGSGRAQRRAEHRTARRHPGQAADGRARAGDVGPIRRMSPDHQGLGRQLRDPCRGHHRVAIAAQRPGRAGARRRPGPAVTAGSGRRPYAFPRRPRPGQRPGTRRAARPRRRGNLDDRGRGGRGPRHRAALPGQAGRLRLHRTLRSRLAPAQVLTAARPAGQAPPAPGRPPTGPARVGRRCG